jgi:hypothetical protein
MGFVKSARSEPSTIARTSLDVSEQSAPGQRFGFEQDEQIGDPMLADSILDRLVHNAHRIEMRGDSMRKSGGKQSG